MVVAQKPIPSVIIMSVLNRSQVNSTGLAKYAWFLVGYNILVIVWGAMVRATGSGAGCGNHWPTCNGDVLPELSSINTVIELSHRISSTIDGFLVILLVVWAFRAYVRKHRVRRAATWSLVFVIIEGLIGAALVRLELVEDNASTLRAVMIAIHLANTLVLLGWLTLTAWWASGGPALTRADRPNAFLLLVIGLVGMIILSGAGAITALGDTLFPAESLAQGLREDFSPTANFLIRLRIWHPVLAVAVSVFLLVVGNWLKEQDRELRRPVNLLFGIITLQMVAGVVNVLLLVPIWMQMVHLILADALWIALVIVTAIALRKPEKAQLYQPDLMLHASNGKHATAAFEPVKDQNPH